jgi:hypothetical protein
MTEPYSGPFVSLLAQAKYVHTTLWSFPNPTSSSGGGPLLNSDDFLLARKKRL